MKHCIFIISLLIVSGCQKNTVELITPTGGDFAIETTQGRFHTLAHQGKIIFLFFGFTHCPEVCPTTLYRLKKMVHSLSQEEQKKTEILFVSVDYKRDSISHLKKYFENYPQNFYAGMTNESELKNIMGKFGATFRIFNEKKPNDMIIDHTSDIFIINQKGEWVHSLKFDTPVEELIEVYKNVSKLSPTFAQKRRASKIEILDENNSCDLSQTPCQVLNYELSLSPLPIVPEKDYNVYVKLLAPSDTPPLEIDFEGISLNMGYIRPKLYQVRDNLYRGEFYIPACEVQEMDWKVLLIVETTKGKKALGFYMKSLKIYLSQALAYNY
jgi:protein SCO1/2